jgi:hypothetical protein
MKKLSAALAAFVALLSLVACHGDGDSGPTAKVYVSGFENYNPTYGGNMRGKLWTNGVATTMPNAPSDWAPPWFHA